MLIRSWQRVRLPKDTADDCVLKRIGCGAAVLYIIIYDFCD
jgi:hypothetical protein